MIYDDLIEQNPARNVGPAEGRLLKAVELKTLERWVSF
jgi:hypothetical protein